MTDVTESTAWTKAGPVVSRMPTDAIEVRKAQAMATVGTPMPMALWGFATGTWIVGTVIGGAVSSGAISAVAPVLIVFAGTAQFIGGLLAYRRTQALPATAFCSFGGFNVTVGFILLLQAIKLLPMDAPDLLLVGFLFETFCFIALALLVAALNSNLALIAVLGLLTIGYGCSGIPYLVNSLHHGGWGTVGEVGGWFLCASAFFAAYAGMAMILNSTFRREVLPLFGPP